jgi:two-component system chemotaxis response regulator CheB
MAPQTSAEAVLERLKRHRSFGCKFASNGQVFKTGKVYIGPPDYHFLVKERKVLVTKGARENRYRPAIDPLFRSAAVSHGSRVVGVILTGLLDDGTAGLAAVKKCGGLTVVQDPKDAEYAEMPQSALANVDIDHTVPLSEMGGLLEKLVRGRAGRRVAIPQDIRIEAEIAERVLSDVSQVNQLGDQVPYNCPNCGGVLWGVQNRYRCHTGHSFTGPALLASQSERIEETLWISLRMLEERKNLLNRMAQSESRPARKASLMERATDTQVHIERIRSMLVSRESKLAVPKV